MSSRARVEVTQIAKPGGEARGVGEVGLLAVKSNNVVDTEARDRPQATRGQARRLGDRAPGVQPAARCAFAGFGCLRQGIVGLREQPCLSAVALEFKGREKEGEGGVADNAVGQRLTEVELLRRSLVSPGACGSAPVAAALRRSGASPIHPPGRPHMSFKGCPAPDVCRGSF